MTKFSDVLGSIDFTRHDMSDASGFIMAVDSLPDGKKFVTFLRVDDSSSPLRWFAGSFGGVVVDLDNLSVNERDDRGCDGYCASGNDLTTYDRGESRTWVFTSGCSEAVCDDRVCVDSNVEDIVSFIREKADGVGSRGGMVVKVYYGVEG